MPCSRKRWPLFLEPWLRACMRPVALLNSLLEFIHDDLPLRCSMLQETTEKDAWRKFDHYRSRSFGQNTVDLAIDKCCLHTAVNLRVLYFSSFLVFDFSWPNISFLDLQPCDIHSLNIHAVHNSIRVFVSTFDAVATTVMSARISGYVTSGSHGRVTSHRRTAVGSVDVVIMTSYVHAVTTHVCRVVRWFRPMTASVIIAQYCIVIILLSEWQFWLINYCEGTCFLNGFLHCLTIRSHDAN